MDVHASRSQRAVDRVGRSNDFARLVGAQQTDQFAKLGLERVTNRLIHGAPASVPAATSSRHSANNGEGPCAVVLSAPHWSEPVRSAQIGVA
jgi:hypothetical protein